MRVYFVCADGYETQDQQILLCQEDRSWDFDPPVCTAAIGMWYVHNIIAGTNKYLDIQEQSSISRYELGASKTNHSHSLLLTCCKQSQKWEQG